MTTLDRQLVDRAVSAEPEWLARRRLSAFESFERLGMPDEKDELWKYVDLEFELSDFSPSSDGPAATVSPSPLADVIDGPRISLVDGVAGTPSEVVEGVTVQPVAAAIDDHLEVLERAAHSAVLSGTDVFAAAHDAFGTGGVLVHVARHIPAPTVLVDVMAAKHNGISFPRVVIATEESAEASVVIHLRSEDDAEALVVPRIEVASGPASNVKLSIVQTLDSTTRSIGHLRAVIDRDATVTIAEAGIGAALARWHLSVDLEGRGSNADIVGAYFGDSDQVLDYRYFMHHAGLNTNSQMFLKGAVEDQALSVFTGMIRIDEGAQRTDAFQTNRNLILSDGAAAQSVPNLEILANDVKCGHGSSVGPLDEEQRYYLMSRGIDEEHADRLQVRGFFEEAISRFPHSEIAAPLRAWINNKFIAAQEAGRL